MGNVGGLNRKTAGTGDGPAGAADRPDADDLSHQAHRQLIGYLGILLPLILVVLAGLRPTPGLSSWAPLGSISAYYYTGAVAAFVGILFALALFLLTYRGYKEYRADRIAGTVGGIAALGVALFPTGAPGDVPEPSWWTPVLRGAHYISAVSLFVVFIVFALWLFRKTNQSKRGSLSGGKRWRNRVYLVCGLIMAVSVLWAGSSLFTGAPIFWPEAIALWAFAFSWLVKGYAHRSVANLVRGALGR